MGKVIYVFPASGKSFLCQKNKNYIELASEDFHWLNIDKTEEQKGKYYNLNSEWPENYLKAIIEAKDKYDYVFITHSGSLLCKKYNINYDIIYPSIECKNEYIFRMKKRGNNDLLIQNMEDNFERYIISCQQDNYANEKIELGLGEYLEDGIRKLEELNSCPLLDSFDMKENLISTSNSTNKFREKTKRIIESLNVNFALIIFDNNFLDFLIENKIGTEIGRFYSGSDYSKIILVDNFIITKSFLGGPNASAIMEELAYYGIKYYFSVGTACKIIDNPNLNCILVKKAIRDEGTSLFYKAPSLYAYTNNYLNNLLYNELEMANIKYQNGITWTIDAYYRENLERMKKRIEQGAMSIDMESSVWCSVAESLNLSFSQLLFFTDIVKGNDWLKEKSNSEIKFEISNLGLDISKKLVRKLGD